MVKPPKSNALKDLREARALIRGGKLIKRYPGELGEKLYIDPAMWGDDTSTGNITRILTAGQRRYRNEMQRVIDRQWYYLFSLYEIDLGKEPADSWKSLAQALVAQHVPGLQITHERPAPRKGRGAPVKWTLESQARLIVYIEDAIQEIAEERGLEMSAVTITSAVERVLKRPEYKYEWPGKVSREYLRKRYHAFKRDIVERNKRLSLAEADAKTGKKSPLQRLMEGDFDSPKT